MAAVRSVCQGNNGSEMLRNTKQLTEELLAYKDEPAENMILHQVQIVRSQDQLHRTIVPFCFRFASEDRCRAAMLYWIYGLIVHSLAIKLATTVPMDHVSWLDVGAIRVAQTRNITNLLMSWDAAKAGSIYGFLDLTQACLAIWAALQTLDIPTFHGKSVSDIKMGILPAMHGSFMFWDRPATAEAMDLVADTLLGGPVQHLT